MLLCHCYYVLLGTFARIHHVVIIKIAPEATRTQIIKIRDSLWTLQTEQVGHTWAQLWNCVGGVTFICSFRPAMSDSRIIVLTVDESEHSARAFSWFVHLFSIYCVWQGDPLVPFWKQVTKSHFLVTFLQVTIFWGRLTCVFWCSLFMYRRPQWFFHLIFHVLLQFVSQGKNLIRIEF